jgi:hypothetical protein
MAQPCLIGPGHTMATASCLGKPYAGRFEPGMSKHHAGRFEPGMNARVQKTLQLAAMCSTSTLSSAACCSRQG